MAVKTASEMTSIVSGGALNSTPTNFEGTRKKSASGNFFRHRGPSTRAWSVPTAHDVSYF